MLVCASSREESVSEPLKILSCRFDEEGSTDVRFIASNFLAKILIRSLFLLPNFRGLVNSRDLNKGFSSSIKLFDFGKFFSILSI